MASHPRKLNESRRSYCFMVRQKKYIKITAKQRKDKQPTRKERMRRKISRRRRRSIPFLVRIHIYMWMYTYIIIGYVFVYVVFENRFNRMTLSVLVYGFTECTRNARLTSHRMLNSVKETLSLSMYYTVSQYTTLTMYMC